MQARFVDEYLMDMNATQACIRAGYSTSGAQTTGSALLAKPHIRKVIDEAIAKRSEITRINADWVLQRLSIESEADIADIYHHDGSIKSIHEWPLIFRQGLVTGVKMKDGKIDSVRLSDRIRILELIGKHVKVGAFEEVLQHKGLDDLAERLRRARLRDEQ